VGYADSVVTLSDRRKIESDLGAGQVVLWDIATGHEIQKLNWHHSGVTGLGFIRDSKQLISADKNGKIAVWDISSLREQGILRW
jgi:WD40 repeat protein